MRKLEAVVKEIVDELGYLQRREMKMRDTNGGCTEIAAWCQLATAVPDVEDLTSITTESTNNRVRNFAVMIMVGIIILGVWQVSAMPHEGSLRRSAQAGEQS